MKFQIQLCRVTHSPTLKVDDSENEKKKNWLQKSQKLSLLEKN